MDRQTVIRDLTLMLLSLTSWEEKDRGLSETRSWKGYDFDVLNELEDEGLIAGSRRAKSVALTDDALSQADDLLKQYGIVLDLRPTEQRFFRLRLTFDFTELTCTRTLLVPEHTSFEDFHTMIQACFGWMNYHLYEFILITGGEEVNISWPDYETGKDPRLESLWEGEEVCRWLNPVNTYLDDVFPKTREAVYNYDFGDDWSIRIHVLNIRLGAFPGYCGDRKIRLSGNIVGKDRTVSIVGSCLVAGGHDQLLLGGRSTPGRSTAAGAECEYHHGSKKQSKNLFHLCVLL